ncbi:MAG: hypothetical protein JWN04_5289 [Myxococcaceae bacterium]|nr:hypothetical protein [Myxococcaceae bacterium]
MRHVWGACLLLELAGCAAQRTPRDPPREHPGATRLGVDLRYPLHPSERLAPELADAVSLARLAEGRAEIAVFGDHRFELQSSEDRQTGEHSMLFLLQNGNRDMSNFVCRSVDAKIGATYPAPHYDLPACPEAWVEGVVLARFEGAGTLSRLWLASKTIAHALPDQTRVRIYRDRQRDPVVDMPLRELLDGENPVFAAPFGMPQQTQVGWYYPVVFSDGLIIAIDEVPRLDAVYYQAQVTRDGAHASSPTALVQQREHARRALMAPMVSVPEPRFERVMLAPGAERVVFEQRGPATIEAFSLTTPSLALLEPIRVRVFWDGADEPAIDLPARELFGSALAAPEVASSWLAAQQVHDGLRLTLALPMPFAAHAKVVLSNAGDTSVELRAGVALDARVPARAFGNLHALRNETLGPSKATHHPLAQASGRGRWVGLCVALEGHAWSRPLYAEPMNFLEGDPTTLVDGAGAHASSLRGTGTEDIFDSVFYFQNAPLVTPFVQTWGVDKKHGKASACRWNVHGSELDFTSSLDARLEVGPGQPELLDRYRTVAFVYR